MTTKKEPLAGLRVVDFCWVGAGALVTQALALLGAEVIKVESVTHPDNLRLSGPFRDDRKDLNGSGYFASRNSNKRSFALNMAHPDGPAVARRLIATASVVTSNFRPGVMERWGLDYDAVRAIRSDVVYLAMPMQGSNGPHRDYVGFGSTIAAVAGLVEPTGLPERAPIGTGTHYPDHVPNPGHALVAVLAALLRQRRTGVGAYIELAQLESTVNVVGPSLLAASLGQQAPRRGNHADEAVPRGVYPCAGHDRWCAISVVDDRAWSALADVLGDMDFGADARFATVSSRRANEAVLDDLLASRTMSFDAWELASRCQAAGVAAAVVETASDIASDPNLVARGFWQTLEHPVMGPYRVGSLPFHLDGAAGRPTRRAPLLGEDTDDLARELLGMSAEEIAACRREGVLQ